MGLVTDRIKKSSEHLVKYVWPIARGWFDMGDIIPVEGVTDDQFRKELDKIAGIDAWQINYEYQFIRGIANRVQWYKDIWKRSWPFNTFTIRYKVKTGGLTEYDKRTLAYNNMDEFLLFPAITIQSYLSDDGKTIYSIGAIFTKDLIHASIKYKKDWMIREVEGGNEMMVLGWEELKKRGYSIYIHNG